MDPELQGLVDAVARGDPRVSRALEAVLASVGPPRAARVDDAVGRLGRAFFRQSKPDAWYVHTEQGELQPLDDDDVFPFEASPPCRAPAWYALDVSPQPGASVTSVTRLPLSVTVGDVRCIWTGLITNILPANALRLAGGKQAQKAKVLGFDVSVTATTMVQPGAQMLMVFAKTCKQEWRTKLLTCTPAPSGPPHIQEVNVRTLVGARIDFGDAHVVVPLNLKRPGGPETPRRHASSDTASLASRLRQAMSGAHPDLDEARALVSRASFDALAEAAALLFRDAPGVWAVA